MFSEPKMLGLVVLLIGSSEGVLIRTTDRTTQVPQPTRFQVRRGPWYLAWPGLVPCLDLRRVDPDFAENWIAESLIRETSACFFNVIRHTDNLCMWVNLQRQICIFALIMVEVQNFEMIMYEKVQNQVFCQFPDKVGKI